MVFVYKKLTQFAVRGALPTRRSESPVCATDNKPSWCCICWAGLLGRVVFPPWNEGPNFGSYSLKLSFKNDGKIKTFPDKKKKWENSQLADTHNTKFYRKSFRLPGKDKGGQCETSGVHWPEH